MLSDIVEEKSLQIDIDFASDRLNNMIISQCAGGFSKNRKCMMKLSFLHPKEFVFEEFVSYVILNFILKDGNLRF